MDRIFKQQIRWNVDVYVDDMVVKSQSIAQHMADLEEVFGVLHKYDMHLNSEKCTFRVSGGKFLGSRSRTHWGIKAIPAYEVFPGAFLRLVGHNFLQWSCLNPFGEVVDSD